MTRLPATPSLFLAYLIELYTAQYADSAGAVNYDTPAFRQGLADLDAMAAALKAEPKITYGRKRPWRCRRVLKPSALYTSQTPVPGWGTTGAFRPGWYAGDKRSHPT